MCVAYQFMGFYVLQNRETNTLSLYIYERSNNKKKYGNIMC